MRAVVQRVDFADVTSCGELTGKIGKGFMVLVGSEVGDTEQDMIYISDKISGLRVFEDSEGKMNRSIIDEDGSVLLVSQFTLLGDARHGRRPSFSNAEKPEIAEPLLVRLAERLRGCGIPVETGRFRTDMIVTLANNGPVTILLDSRKLF